VSTYRFKQVTADSFVDEHRRVLLAGDAAHLFAPFGGRGMNSGVHDADAAASAVATALRAEMDAIARREVGNYAGLREEAADWNEYASGEALEHIYSDRLLPNVKKRAAAELARVWEPAGAWLDSAHFGPHAGPPVPTEGKF
jgi:3-(3-hydroxy-phenyl)propionate hydroxylase